MHIPDGFLNAGTSAGGGVIAAGGVAYGLRRVQAVSNDVAIPLTGLAAAYVFAVQMLNFPVANGTSGHLLGGVLAAVLVGPWLGLICVAVVLGVQALLFADGGMSALGINVVNMAIIGALGGYAIFAAVRGLAGRDRRGILIATAIAAWSAPVLAAGAFTIEYAIGGNNAVSTPTVMWSMLGTHALIGIGEAVITTLTVSAVLASRPDLVYGARRAGLDDASLTNRRPVKAFIATSAAVIVLLVAAVSPFASSSPDGLEKVAVDTGIAASERQSPTTDSPLAGYSVAGIDDDKLATSVSGIIGTSVTVAFGLGLFAFTRRRRSRPA